jgi:hypothetical protein
VRRRVRRRRPGCRRHTGQRRREPNGQRGAGLNGHHLLYALTQPHDGAVAELLMSYGSSAATLNAEVKGGL